MFFYTISIMDLYTENIVNGIFLFMIVVLGNFVVSTVNCDLQRLLTNNIYIKNIVIIVILYFAIDLRENSGNGSIYHPIETLLISLSIWFIYLLFTRINITLALIVFVLLLSTYVVDRYLKYYIGNNYDKKSIKNLIKLRKYLFVTIIILILIGNILFYLIDNKKISFLKFFRFYENCSIVPK